jgi:hypothetical protein
MKGNVAAAWAIEPADESELVEQVAIRDHVARRACVHPATLTVSPPDVDGVAVVDAWLPLPDPGTESACAVVRYRVRVERFEGGVCVTDAVTGSRP